MKLCSKCSQPLPPDRNNCIMKGDESPGYYYVHRNCPPPPPAPVVESVEKVEEDEPSAKGTKTKKASKK